jgi:hypothetical protein
LPTPSTVRWILPLNPPRLRPSAWAPCFLGAPAAQGCARTGMRPHTRAVHHAMFQVGSVGDGGERRRRADACLTPTHESFVGAVAWPILGGQQAPLRATAAHPFHRDHETAAGILVGAYRRMRVLAQAVPDLRPVIVGEAYIRHAAMLLLMLTPHMSTVPSGAMSHLKRAERRDEPMIVRHMVD